MVDQYGEEKEGGGVEVGVRVLEYLNYLDIHMEVTGSDLLIRLNG